MSPKKGTISIGNTSSNHHFSGDMLVFKGVERVGASKNNDNPVVSASLELCINNKVRLACGSKSLYNIYHIFVDKSCGSEFTVWQKHRGIRFQLLHQFFLSHSLDDKKHHTHLEQKIKAGFPRFQTRSCLALVNDLSKKPLHEGLDLGGFFLGRLKGEAKKCLHCHPQKKTTTFFPIS